MEDIFEKFKLMLKAFYPVFYIQTFEYERTKDKIWGVVDSIRKENHNKKATIYEWDWVNGLAEYSLDRKPNYIDNTQNIVEVLNILLTKASQNQKDIFIINDIGRAIEREDVKFLIRKIAEEGPYSDSNFHLILMSSVVTLPIDLEKYVTLINIPLPTRFDIGKTLDDITSRLKNKPTAEERDKLIDAALGMTTMEASLAFSLAAVKDSFGPNSQKIVSDEKEQIIKKSGMLEYFPKNNNLKDVGGMEQLKKWLYERHKAYDKKARDWGLKEPKGLLLLGVPGCGKSLTAKCIAYSWSLPLLRLDIGKVYQGLMGSSEANIRKAIATAEAVAPCVLWIDEIEKGLNGTQSSGVTDGGVTSRVFSTILTWMQEKTVPVFIVATANNIVDPKTGEAKLPPELLRKGRFDEIFFVDLPTPEEREKIFKIHLSKNNQDPSHFSFEEILRLSEGHNGAEIEEAVNEAMFAAYIENPNTPKLENKHLLQAVRSIVPLSTTMNEDINALKKWASTRARFASDKPTITEDFIKPIKEL